MQMLRFVKARAAADDEPCGDKWHAHDIGDDLRNRQGQEVGEMAAFETDLLKVGDEEQFVANAHALERRVGDGPVRTAVK